MTTTPNDPRPRTSVGVAAIPAARPAAPSADGGTSAVAAAQGTADMASPENTLRRVALVVTTESSA